MRRALLLAVGALCLGLATAEYLSRNFAFRRWLGELVRRGQLQALVERRGIYDRDLERAWEAERFRSGAQPRPIAAGEKAVILQRLVAETRVEAAAAGETVAAAAVRCETDLLRAQFPDAKTWEGARQRAGLLPWELRRAVTQELRARAWLERQLGGKIRPNELECRRYFAHHGSEFQEPKRLRASHLFLAAPVGYPAEEIESKQALIALLAKRLANGEAFPALVGEFSEDEATKKRGGDLGYFAQARMLPPVWEAASRLQPGQSSPPVRSRLGFHLLRVTESLPARALTFEEAQPAIINALENQRRSAALAALPDR